MPELPEVETIRRQLARKIVGKKINGREITNVRRRAKILMIDFADGSSLILHLGLTGQLIFNGKPSKHTRKVFNFGDGSGLIFNDVRKLGWWKKVKSTKLTERRFGPEALDIDFKTFENILEEHPGARIKPVLMNQKIIAGIGNIYSDEILFSAQIHPFKQIKILSGREIWRIHQNIKKILQKAIRYRGTTERDYRDACGREGNYTKYLQVYYQRESENKRCSRCGTIIKRAKIGGRSAHFCPKCQKI